MALSAFVWGVFILLLITSGKITARNAPQDQQVSVSCNHNRVTCKVEFALDDGSLHSVELIKEKHSIFADGATTSVNGKETEVHGRTKYGNRYHTKNDDSFRTWAVALIAHDGRELVEGIFSTENHGILEFGRETMESTLTRRQTTTVIDRDIVLDNPQGTPWKDAARIAASDITVSEFDASSTPFGQIIPFFPNCYQGDTSTNVFRLNLVYDYGLYTSLMDQAPGDDAAKLSKILSDLETLFGFGKLIFLLQLNVRLEINKIIFGQATDPIPLSRGGPTCTTATQTLKEFMTYISTANTQAPTGFWMHISNCFSGITGVSYVGSLCGRYNGNVALYSWVVIFHELGHGFGMSHSFENGVGTTGGLMDYGLPTYNGVVQFHPLKRPEVCQFLDYLQVDGGCPYFKRADNTATCGDGILDSSEQCECLTQGGKSCGACVNCQLTNSGIQCSTADFIVRQPSTPSTIVAEPTALADSSCCNNGRLAPPKTLCGGSLNVCSVGGQCSPVCTKFLFTDNPNCGFDSSGCQLGCMWKSKCRFDMTFSNPDGTSGLISGVPDGTPCNLPSGQRGTCSNAQCVGEHSSTLRPTSNRVEEQITLQPSPIAAVTPAPTLRTPVPTKATQSPSASARSTADAVRCAKFRRRPKCKKKKCSWCPNSRSCQPAGSC